MLPAFTRSGLVLAALLCGCGSLPRKALLPVPPEEAGGWKRVSLDTPQPAQLPAEVRDLRPVKWVRAVYSRSGTTIVAIGYAMPAEASAFEAEQRHPKGSGTVVFRKGAILASCSSQSEPTAAVLDFVRQLEPVWLGAGKP